MADSTNDLAERYELLQIAYEKLQTDMTTIKEQLRQSRE